MEPDVSSSNHPKRGPALSLHRKYLRATHEYLPEQGTLASYDADGAKTVTLRSGDIILVHLTHSNGWVDGTVLNSGIRGWLPANYCVPYDHEFVRYVLHALTHLWNTCAYGDIDRLWAQAGEEQVHAFIAGVRYLLERTQCLRRTDPAVSQNLTIQRTRKGLLSDLSTFIKHWDGNHFDQHSQPTDKEISAVMEELVFQAFQVAMRAIRFVDVWTQSLNETGVSVAALPSETFPSRQESVVSLDVFAHESGETPSTSEPDPIRSRPQLSKKPSVRFLDSVEMCETSADSAKVKTAAAGLPISRRTLRSPKPKITIETPIKSSMKPTRTQFVPLPSDMASFQLSAAHTNFLDYMGSFIGSHMQSRPLHELIASTRQSMQACDALISVLVSIRDKTVNRSTVLSEIIATLRNRSIALSTKSLSQKSASASVENLAILDPNSTRSIINAATACVRCAGDCVAQAKAIMEADGDIVIGPRLVDGVCASSHQVQNDTSARSSSPLETLVEADSESTPQSLIMTPGTEAPDPLKARSIYLHHGVRNAPSPAESSDASKSPRNDSLFRWNDPGKGNADCGRSGSTSTFGDSTRDSASSSQSLPSSRPTTPDEVDGKPRSSPYSVPNLNNSSTGLEAVFRQITIGSVLDRHDLSHELVYGNNGQILGGSFAALVSTMTNDRAPPDYRITKAFFLTFRSFSSALKLAGTLIRRYQDAGEPDSYNTGGRVRVCQFIETWLEHHWETETDTPALVMFRNFAQDERMPLLPSSRQRLLDLFDRVYARANAQTSMLAPLESSSMPSGSIQTKSASQPAEAKMTKTQMSLLNKYWTSQCSIIDFDAMEIARQLTLLGSRLYCAVQPSELMASVLTKNNGRAPHVLAMSGLSTDLANLVSSTVLGIDDNKKRAALLKQWIKIGHACLQIQNFDCLMAIMCALSSSTVTRLKHTWSHVSDKMMALLDELRGVVDIARNYAVLRGKLNQIQGPCLPFLGIYLTDLTFVDAGNPNTRTISNPNHPGSPVEVINFDKWLRVAKIIATVQSFQVPYDFQPVPKLQEWILEEVERIKKEDTSIHTLYQHSLRVEPRDTRPSTADATVQHSGTVRGRLETMKPQRLVRKRSQLDIRG